MQGLGEGVNVEMVCHARAVNPFFGHEFELALFTPVVANDSDDVLRPHHVGAETILIDGQVLHLRGHGPVQVLGGNVGFRNVLSRSLGLPLRTQYGWREDNSRGEQAKEKTTG